VRLRVEGLNLPVQPARAVIEVSTKPAIALVWMGALLMALGAGIAVVRRKLELSPAARPAHAGPSRPSRLAGRLGGRLLPRVTYR
jgi:cytochrome c-type biogenesis protein CcmF